MKLVSFTINSRTVHKIQHGSGRRYRKFPSKFWDLKVWHGVLFYSKLVPVHVYWYCLCYIKIWFYCTIPYWEYLEKNNVPLLKSYERFTAGSPRWRRCWWRHLPMSDNIFSSRGKNTFHHRISIKLSHIMLTMPAIFMSAIFRAHWCHVGQNLCTLALVRVVSFICL